MKRNYYLREWNHWLKHKPLKFVYENGILICSSMFSTLSDAKRAARRYKHVAPHTKVHIRRFYKEYKVHVINRYGYKETSILLDASLPF